MSDGRTRRKQGKDDRDKLLEWFGKLTPEKRLSLSLEIERFRREAKFVKRRRDVPISKQKSR